eukprot:769097-Rhodomonas_salina.1
MRTSEVGDGGAGFKLFDSEAESEGASALPAAPSPPSPPPPASAFTLTLPGSPIIHAASRLR